MDINMICSIIKMFFIAMCTTIVSIKQLEYKMNKKLRFLVFFESIFLAIVYTIINKYISPRVGLCIIYMLMCCFIKVLIKHRTGNTMLVVLVSMAICLMAFGLSTICSYFLYKIFYLENIAINGILIGIIQVVFLIGFFKIKRFSNGFSFLRNNNEYIDIIMLNISTFIVYVYCLLGNYYHKSATNIFIMFTFLGVFMLVMIQEAFIIQYKQNLLKRELEEYKEEIKEKDKQMKKLSNEKYEISRINHEFYNRQKALELKVVETLSNTRMETAEEIDITNRIEKLTKEYSETIQKIKGKTKLPKADVLEIDDMFKYMQTECIKNNIEFELKINGNINYLINHFIPKNKLETMIGDHIRDAIIAINSSENNNKGILVILGIKENCYEFCICDTGIEFEIDTLLKLGLERTTTHKETGGTGIGFMTTFETMNECMASLTIEEHPISNNNYTKSVTIRFDGKNEYRIKSYRASEIKKESNNNRIIIERL